MIDKPSHDQMFNLRVDHSISNTQHAFARYSQEWNKQTWQGCGGTAESNCYDGLIPRHSFVAGHTWTARPTLVNEFRFQYAISSYLLGPSGQPIFTSLGQYPGVTAGATADRLQLPELPLRPGLRRTRHREALGVQRRRQLRAGASTT